MTRSTALQMTALERPLVMGIDKFGQVKVTNGMCYFSDFDDILPVGVIMRVKVFVGFFQLC